MVMYKGSFILPSEQRLLEELAQTHHLATEYERNLGKLIFDKCEKLEELKKNDRGNTADILKIEEEIETLRSLFENYNLGMGYFRRARGGRSGLRE